MKRAVIIINIAVPAIFFLFLQAMLTSIGNIYLQYYQDTMGAGFPKLTRLLIGDPSITRITCLILSLVFLIAGLLIKKRCKNDESLLIAFSVYHLMILSITTAIIGTYLIAFALPIVGTLVMKPY